MQAFWGSLLPAPPRQVSGVVRRRGHDEMKWLPYYSWRIETTDTDSAVIRRVEARVDDVDSDGPGEGRTLFEGAVRGNEFCLFRIAASKNLFLPVIRGKVLSTPGGAVVKVKMRPHG